MGRVAKHFLVILSFVLTAGAAAAGTAQEAWNKLAGPPALKQAAFAYVSHNPQLPNVLIYGDSISIGYTPQLRAALSGQANLYRLHCNGGDASSVIGKMDKMHAVMRDKKLTDPWTFEWDVIQINVGLHDLKYMLNDKLDVKNGKQVASVEQYVANLKEVIAYLKKTAPKARLIFATTTPVPENSNGRVAGDALRYNQAALELLKSHPEIAVNDLYSFTKPNQEKWWSAPGNVHFNQEGCTAQGNETARIILQALKP